MLKKIEFAEIRYNVPAKDPNTNAYIVGQAMMPKFNHTYEINPEERGEDAQGNKRFEYPNGLDLSKYPEDAETQEAVKPIVEEALKALEATYGKGALDSFSPAWKSVKLIIDKETIHLNLKMKNGRYENPENARLYWAIKGGAFGIIASSYEELKNSHRPKRFVLSEPSVELDLDVADDMTNDKAIVTLVELMEKGKYYDLFYIHKNLVSADTAVVKNTPKEVLYSNLRKYILGEFNKNKKKNCPKDFLDVCKAYKEDRQQVIITAYVNDAYYYDIISTDASQRLKNNETQTVLGSTVKNAVKFLMEPKNVTELENIRDRVKLKWDK
jgi:hypothetical protein